MQTENPYESPETASGPPLQMERSSRSPWRSMRYGALIGASCVLAILIVGYGHAWITKPTERNLVILFFPMRVAMFVPFGAIVGLISGMIIWFLYWIAMAISKTFFRDTSLPTR